MFSIDGLKIIIVGGSRGIGQALILGFIQANIKLSIERDDLSEKLKSWLKEEFLNGDV